MRLLKRFCVLILGLAMPLAMPSVVRADAVTDWNAIAVQTIVNGGPTHGSAVGAQAAAGIIALRAIDGSFPLNPPPFTGGTDPGVWRPTPSYLPGPPPTLSAALAPWLATVTPFTLKSPSQFRPLAPPTLTSERYATAYNEVKDLGAADPHSTRTPEQTDLAKFWNSNFLVLWNRALRDIVGLHVPDIGDSARIFALASLAMGDAGITAW